MYRVQLSEEQQQELQRRTHEPGVRPRTRDHLEMVRLAATGQSVPQIALTLARCEKCVRRWIKTFVQSGFDALRDQPPVGQTSSLTPTIGEALRKELAKGECTWTSAQMADWITTEFGVTVSAAHLRRFRKRWKLTYQRTARSIQHKQEPAAVASKKEELAELEKRGSRACLTSTIATSSAAR